MSGGPVLNSEGELVAIHGRGDRDDSNAKTGFNLGISINRFATIASNLGVTLNQSIATIPQSTTAKPDDYIALARQKYSKGDYRGTLADYNRAIQLNPNYDIAYYNRGSLKEERLEDVRGALTDYNRAIQLDPNDDYAYYARGVLKKQKLQDVQGALADFNRAIQFHPNQDMFYHSRGVLKMQKLQDVQGALADFNRAIQLDPNYSPNTYFWRGRLKYEKLADKQGAIADMRRAAELFQKQGNKKSYQHAIDYLNKINGGKVQPASTNRPLKVGGDRGF